MGRGRSQNGRDPIAALMEEQIPIQTISPVDFPLPMHVFRTFMFRVDATPDREWYTLRITPVAPVGPGQYAPSTDHHDDIQFAEPNMLELIQHFTNLMTDEQKAKVRAMLSDIELPPAPELILP